MYRRVAYLVDLGEYVPTVTDTLAKCLALHFRFETVRYLENDLREEPQKLLRVICDELAQDKPLDAVLFMRSIDRASTESKLLKKRVIEELRKRMDHIYYAVAGEESQQDNPLLRIEQNEGDAEVKLHLLNLAAGKRWTAWERYRLRPAPSKGLDLYMSLAGGAEILNELTQQIFPHCTGGVIDLMSQGASLSRVFRLDLIDFLGAEESYVLKVTPSSKMKRIELEWKRRQNAQNILEDKYFRNIYGQSFPRMYINAVGCDSSSLRKPGIAAAREWVAAAYQLIGPSFLCLEDIYSNEEAFNKITSALTECLNTLFTALQTTSSRFEKRKLWVDSQGNNDADSETFKGYPPYDLRSQKKLEIMRSLDLLKRYAEGFLTDTQCQAEWKKACDSISGMVHEGLTCQREIIVWLCPTHGDLNGHNILFTGKPTKVVFIDLAWFALESHALHDYARLEAEFKFALMDCGRKRPDGVVYDLAGKNELLLWLKSESDSLSSLVGGSINVWSDSNCRERCYQLIDQIRTHAGQSQSEKLQELEPAVFVDSDVKRDFVVAYKTALLHCTLNSITYETLPFQKRIFAVLSAGKLIDYLKDTL